MQYCSTKCAEEDWKWHKDFCRKKQEKKRKRKLEKKQEEDVGEATMGKQEKAVHVQEKTVIEEERCSAMVSALKLN